MQFTDDPALVDAVRRAGEIALEDITLRVLSRVDLLHEKLRAATDSARRRSKRLQYLADAQALLESTPALNRTARDSDTHALEPECRSVRCAHENSGGQGRRAHSARYPECANLMHLDLAAELTVEERALLDRLPR